jgi:imidazolonepropionase
MHNLKVDLILSGASQVLTCAPAAGDPLGCRRGAAIAIQGEKILAVAPLAELGQKFDLSAAQTVELAGQIVAPGFVDCHTHLIFGGTRAQEYGARMTRTSAEVAALGIPTGIQATVTMTRNSSQDELYQSAMSRMQNMLRCGTTTLESKSGYGLSVEKELNLLQVNQRLQGSQPVDIVSTFLGAHDFPPETPRAQYLESLIHEMIPQAAQAGSAEFCDVYCDDGYYTVEESRRILEAGLRHGLKPKIHVDAYSNIGGSAMSAELNVVSADHLNFTTAREIELLAKAGVVGVVMPGLDFAVRHPKPFNARLMLDKGLTVALATDLCPGCWMESMQLVMQLACRSYQFSPQEALLAATAGSARAVGLTDRGTLEPGKLADLQVWDLPTFEDLIYRLGNNAVSMVVKRGQVIHFER